MAGTNRQHVSDGERRPWVAHARGHLDRAEAFGREALGLLRELNDGWWTARCLNVLIVLAVELGDPLRASRLLGAAPSTCSS